MAVAQHYPALRDLRARCEQCHAEKLVAFSCKKRGFRPSCGARRMAETAALLADEVLPERPLRQWVLSLPHALRFLLATNPAALTQVLGVVYRTIARYLIGQAGANEWQRLVEQVGARVKAHAAVVDRRSVRGRSRPYSSRFRRGDSACAECPRGVAPGGGHGAA